MEGKKELEISWCALCNSEYFQHSEGYMYVVVSCIRGGTMSER